MLWFLPSKTSHLKSIDKYKVNKDIINKSEENKDITLKKYQQIQRKQRHYIEKYQQIQTKTCIFRVDRRQDKPSLLLNQVSLLHKLGEEKLLILITKAVKKNRDLYPRNFRTNIMHLTVPFPSSPIWRRVWGSQQLDKRSQLENLPQPDQHHVDQHESHDIVKILSIVFLFSIK